MAIPESCKILAKHMSEYGDFNILGQSLQLQCQLDKSDFTKPGSIEDLKRKAKLIGHTLMELAEREPRAHLPKHVI